MNLNSIIDLFRTNVAYADDSIGPVATFVGHVNKYILNPLITYVLDKIYPYLVISVIIFLLTLLIAIAILVLVIKK